MKREATEIRAQFKLAKQGLEILEEQGIDEGSVCLLRGFIEGLQYSLGGKTEVTATLNAIVANHAKEESRRDAIEQY